MQDSIYLYSRGDRLGGHILQYILLTIYAFYNNLFIVYEPDKVKYRHSPFVKAILKYIDKFNLRFSKKREDYLNKYTNFQPQEYCLDFKVNYDPNNYFYSCDLILIGAQVVFTIKSDPISYFKKYIGNELTKYLFHSNILPANYVVPFDPKKTILVHLRLEDVRDRDDYDGEYCSNYYRNIIDSDSKQISGIVSMGWRNMQTPLAREKVEKCIREATAKHPTHEIVMIAAPGDYDIGYPYRCIRSEDESYDLFLLSSAEVIVLSRSTFSLVSTFFSNSSSTDVWCPLWGHFTGLALYTKYDKTQFNYFF